MPHIGLICDLVEEGWPSMDLVGTMLETSLMRLGGNLKVTRLCPPMRRRLTAVNRPASQWGFNSDRFLNRFWDYPRWLRARAQDFDLFHLVDQSYAQLVHELPPHRTVVSCHDLDTFRSVLEPDQEPRSAIFRAMVGRILSGLRKAAWITCGSESTRSAILDRQLFFAGRVSVLPYGLHSSCSPCSRNGADEELAKLCGPADGEDLVHVGSTVPRKRIDVLLRVFAKVQCALPGVRLLRVGGAFTAAQSDLARQLRIADKIVILPFLETELVAAAYRRSALTLFPSEREGFGLPLAESMACGTPVVASDIPVFREVGGDAAEYCAVEKIEAWADCVIRLLHERRNHQAAWLQRQQQAIRRAARFSWDEHAAQLAGIYAKVLAQPSLRTKRMVST
jgi:glycosyltransferase involved in cell wall biosynthesis